MSMSWVPFRSVDSWRPSKALYADSILLSLVASRSPVASIPPTDLAISAPLRSYLPVDLMPTARTHSRFWETRIGKRATNVLGKTRGHTKTLKIVSIGFLPVTRSNGSQGSTDREIARATSGKVGKIRKGLPPWIDVGQMSLEFDASEKVWSCPRKFGDNATGFEGSFFVVE